MAPKGIRSDELMRRALEQTPGDGAGPAARAAAPGPRIGIAREIAQAGEGAFAKIDALERQAAQDRAAGRLAFELDPETIGRGAHHDRDAGFAADPSFASFVDSIRDDGQLIPIGVRKRPDGWEAVWGRRRIEACRRLKRPVLAVEVGADELRAAALGWIENAQRAAVSLIEQGRFFALLLRDGLVAEQKDIAEALKVSKTQVSTAIAAAQIPDDLLEALGPWRQLSSRQALRLVQSLERPGAAERLPQAIAAAKTKADLADATEAALDAFGRAAPARRARKSKPAAAAHAQDGRVWARREAGRAGAIWRFPKGVDPAFLAWAWDKLAELRTAFERERSGG